MSSVIGRLRVVMGLDNAQFTKGIGGAGSSLNRFAARAGKMAAGVAASMKTAFVSMGVSAVQAGAEIDRLSQVSNTLPQQFQGWAAGARSVGIEQEKLADILKDTNDRIGDYVQTGGGPMADFFDKIAPKVGVTAAAFRGLSGADALQLYVSSLEKANVNQQDFTFYMEAMASDSTLLLPLLRNGGSAMADYADRAERMGAVMGGPMLASLREGKAGLAQMKLAIEGMRNTIGVMAVPAIKALAAAITAAAMFFHTHAEAIGSAMRTLAGIAIVVATVLAARYAWSVGVAAVRAMAAAVTQSIALEMALGAQSRMAAIAGVASKGLATALGVLRGAIIATGIGALIVAAGVMVGKFLELVQMTGSFGGALKVLGDLSKLVWQAMIDSAAAIPPGLSAIWNAIKADFIGMTAELQARWATFLTGMSNTVNANPALNALFGDSLAGVAEDAISKWEALAAAQADARAAAEASGKEAAGIISDAFAPVADAWAKLKTTVDEGMTPDVPGTPATALEDIGGGADKAAKGAQAAKEKLTELQRVVTELRAEAAKLKATMGMSEADAAAWENLRSAKVSADSNEGQEITSLTKQIKAMETLKSATEDWRETLRSSFSELVQRGAKFSDVLSTIIGKFADMIFSQGFDMVWAGSGFGKASGKVLASLGVGANANGTKNWEGGLTRLHERGGEIMNLPGGTQIIPNDISKRMADASAQAPMPQVRIVPSEYFDAVVDGRAATVVRTAAPSIQRGAVGAVRKGSAQSKKFLGV